MPTMEDLTEEFKEVYKDKGAHDLSSQIKYLAALGDYYHQRGAEISDWVCLLKVSHVNYAVSIHSTVLEVSFKVLHVLQASI